MSLAKAIGWAIVFMLLGWLVTTSLVAGWAWAVYGDIRTGVEALAAVGARQTLVAGMAQLLGFGFATWVVGVRVLGLGRAELRWASARVGSYGLGIGLGLGAAAAITTLLAAVLLADSGWSQDSGGFGQYVADVTKMTLVLAPAAFSEELIFRGVPLVLVAAVVGRGTALVAVAGVVFALFHGLNPDVTMLGLGNVALAGIFLGVAFFAPGGLWTACGAHLGWNAALAALDAPVSGLPFEIPFLDYHAGEPVWLSGGRFGPEGGLLATITITAALLVASRWTGKETT